MGIKLLARPNEDGFEIVGNRDGLRRLAEVCMDLADLPEDTAEAQKMGAQLPSLLYKPIYETGVRGPMFGPEDLSLSV